MAGLGFQIEECQMRYNVDKATTTRQGAEDACSDTVTATDLSRRMGNRQVQGKTCNQSKYIVPCCVAVDTELHEAYESPRTRQVLAVVTAVSMLYKVMHHMWGPTEVAKWSVQLAVNYVQLAQADASSRFGGSNQNST